MAKKSKNSNKTMKDYEESRKRLNTGAKIMAMILVASMIVFYVISAGMFLWNWNQATSFRKRLKNQHFWTQIVFLYRKPARAFLLTLEMPALKDCQTIYIMFYLKCICNTAIINIGETVPRSASFYGALPYVFGDEGCWFHIRRCLWNYRFKTLSPLSVKKE